MHKKKRAPKNRKEADRVKLYHMQMRKKGYGRLDMYVPIVVRDAIRETVKEMVEYYEKEQQNES